MTPLVSFGLACLLVGVVAGWALRGSVRLTRRQACCCGEPESYTVSIGGTCHIVGPDYLDNLVAAPTPAMYAQAHAEADTVDEEPR